MTGRQSFGVSVQMDNCDGPGEPIVSWDEAQIYPMQVFRRLNRMMDPKKKNRSAGEMVVLERRDSWKGCLSVTKRPFLRMLENRCS